MTTLAPNETPQGNARKNELFAIRDTRPLTLEELQELRELTRAAISHLKFSYPAKNNTNQKGE